MSNKYRPEITVGARVYSLGDHREGTVTARKLRLGTVQWDAGDTDERTYLCTIAMVATKSSAGS